MEMKSTISEGNELRPPSPFVEEEKHKNENNPKHYIGREARNRFWELFKSSNKKKDDQVNVTSAAGEYIRRIEKMKLLPEPLGIARLKGQVQNIDLKCYGIGDSYGNAFAASFVKIPNVCRLNLSDNRVGDATGQQLFLQMVEMKCHLVEVDVSKNGLSLLAMKQLKEYLTLENCTLKALNLEGNLISDAGIVVLANGLSCNRSVERLNLGKNKFGTTGVQAIASYADTSLCLKELYLCWCRINQIGALSIVQAIIMPSTLKVLDLSWNNLGSTKSAEMITAMATCLAENTVLQHLDLSNNRIVKDHCQILADHLDGNHVLLGIHMTGNHAYVDTKGHLIPCAKPISLQQQHCTSLVYEYESYTHSHNEIQSKEPMWSIMDKNCWYCGRWSEYKFAWKPPGPLSRNATVFLHLSLDEWKEDQMHYLADEGGYALFRVLQPGRTQFFVSVVDHAENASGKETKTRTWYTCPNKKMSKLLSHKKHSMLIGPLTMANYVEIAPNIRTPPCEATEPRPNGIVLKKTTWDLRKTVFESRCREAHCRNFLHTDAFILHIFKVDWKQTKAERIVKNADQRDALEAVVSKHYRELVSLHVLYCAKSIALQNARKNIEIDVTCVTWAMFVEFLRDFNLIDEKSEYCRTLDFENLFVATNLEINASAKELDNPDKSLTRFEFLECFYRIAINMYMKTGVCATPDAAFDMFMEKSILPNTRQDPDVFRRKFLYQKCICELLQDNIVMLQNLFDKSCSKFTRPGDKKGLSIVQFLDCLDRIGIFDSKSRPADVRIIFLDSIMTVIDPMTTSEHKKLKFTGFLESIIRIANLKYGTLPTTPEGVFESSCVLFNYLSDRLDKRNVSKNVDKDEVGSLPSGRSKRGSRTKNTRRRSSILPRRSTVLTNVAL